ncbi:MAG TPA: hypothetical protein VN084_07300 [Methylophilaceae bacterium]|nr:hypothetical protein [Methylophilaceae bacterium]
MLAKIILYATNDGLTAGLWQSGQCRESRMFACDEAGVQAFEQYLQQHLNVSIYILCDSIEEDYRLESLPHTSGSSRQELLTRKLAQAYRNSPFRVAHFINREKTKRKDDRFLFAALNKEEFLQKWLACIERQQAPLVGVYLISMISQLIVRRHKIMDPHILLSEKLSSGFRQSYLHNGRLRISRLAPIPDSAQNQLNYFYNVETEKTRLYLVSQRFITRETPLTIVLPALADTVEAVKRSLEQEQGIECKVIDLAAFAKTLKLDPEAVRRNPELVHMHLLATGNVPDNLAPASLIKNHQVNALRQWTNLASGLVLLIGLVLAALNFNQALDDEAAISQAALETRVQEQRYAEVAKDFPATPLPAADLQQAVEIHHQLVEAARSPRMVMEAIGRGLAQTPEIDVVRLHLMRSEDIDVKDTSALNATAPVAVSTQANAAPAGTLYQICFLNGEIRAFTGDYRAALASVTRLVDKLKADPAIEQVSIAQEPVNLSSFSNLSGSTVDEQAARLQAAAFQIKIVFKPEPTSP